MQFKNKKDTYVLGVGLSHDGSACLMKNGKICFAIEKERITRVKHDGFSDTEAVNYCLSAEGITLDDVDLVVQNSNYGFFEYGNTYFKNQKRLFDDSVEIPIITISHHLAHAYYAIGTSPFEESVTLVLDGCGSLYDECIDLDSGIIHPNTIPKDLEHLYAEKDSFYTYKNNQLRTIYKDFSPFGLLLKDYPMHPGSTKHSIGGMYSAAAEYCFGNDSDTGKLMGLAPYGRPGVYHDEIFELKDEKVYVNYSWMHKFKKPVRYAEGFWNDFQYYADIAYWVQKETERAILYLVRARKRLTAIENFCFTGGVALNAVVNGAILKEELFKNIYFTPAAGDNGLAIGCAYYGWLEVLKRERVFHDGDSCFGKVYPKNEIESVIQNFTLPAKETHTAFVNSFFELAPLFINGNAPRKEHYLIQFVLLGVGNYFLELEGMKVVSSGGEGKVPDCVVTTDPSTFITFLKDESALFKSMRNGKSVVKGDLNYFKEVLRLENLVGFIKESMVKNKDLPKVAFVEEENVTKKVARLLSDGKVIGWFQGACEFGPRALGHRSILADPRKTGVQKFINNKVKFREDFRPFAPAVLEEYVSDYFHFSGQSPYMIVVAPIRDEWKEELPGVVHVDGSCRIQTVDGSWNKKFFDLLVEFKSLTGVPILLNTSFNCKGMPIIETPLQALDFFFECELDYLVLGNFIISKESTTFEGVLGEKGNFEEVN